MCISSNVSKFVCVHMSVCARVYMGGFSLCGWLCLHVASGYVCVGAGILLYRSEYVPEWVSVYLCQDVRVCFAECA